MEEYDMGSDVESERDEVKEVRRVAQRETFNVKVWRFAMSGALLMTAMAVTFTTYKFLKNDQYEAFETAVSCGELKSHVD